MSQFTLQVSTPAAMSIWADHLTRMASAPSLSLLPAPVLTDEEKAERDSQAQAYMAQREADEAKIPTFLAALEALCREHGVTIKAENSGSAYEGDTFTAYLGLAPIEILEVGAE